MDEQSALKLCLVDHDPRGFEFLVKKYRREAYYHAFTFLGNNEDAVDACQESFTRAFAALPMLTKLPSFYPWFYTILRNCCLNMLKRKKTIHNYVQTITRSVKHSNSNVTTTNPCLELEKNEKRTAVWNVLMTLPADSREILVMKYFHGYCYDEISEILSIPRGTVMSRLYYARKTFKEKFEKKHSLHQEEEDQHDIL